VTTKRFKKENVRKLVSLTIGKIGTLKARETPKEFDLLNFVVN